MKKTILSAFVVLLTIPLFAQGFSTFIVDGSLHPAVIKNAKGDEASSIEVIVSPKTDVSNINFKYRLLSGCSVSPAITSDFTQPQKVLITKNDGTSKEWILYVKQLTPASLPLELSFSTGNPAEWNQHVKGWAALGVDQSKPTVIRFGNKGVSFWIAFNEPAKQLEYELKMVSKKTVSFDGEFIVETSVDGQKWKILKEFDERNQISADGKYRHDVSKDVRFIRWTYITRNKLNLNLNNIIVSAK
ncbi:MAG: hypothetical protein PHQ11_07715 [Paludibacter sp.]|nr:hypothetical protein [Paludibacter sp.]MDD4198745.1 hypothetical protein [Paludibacter sp.]MDD4427736.1 hypothetical protein [Paludibacter sp.]